jgi:hypothetical protein
MQRRRCLARRPLGTESITATETTRSVLNVGQRAKSRKRVKLNVQFSLQQATTAQRGSRGIALLFL